MVEQEKVVLLEDVSLSRNEHLVLEHFSLSVAPGEFVYLTGAVGAGKSTLLKSLYAEVPILSGKAEVLGFDLTKLKRREHPLLRRQLGIVFQDFQLLPDRSVYNNLDVVLRAISTKSNTERRLRIAEVLSEVDLENKGYKYPHELSGGEQQRVAIARALLASPRLILADEPTGNLDPETGLAITKLLHRLCQEGRAAVIMSTHNREALETFPARQIHLG